MNETKSTVARGGRTAEHVHGVGCDRRMPERSWLGRDPADRVVDLRSPCEMDGLLTVALRAPFHKSKATNDDETPYALPRRVRGHETTHARHGRHGTRSDGRRRPRLRSPPPG